MEALVVPFTKQLIEVLYTEKRVQVSYENQLCSDK